MNKKHNQITNSGFTIIEGLIILIVITVVGAAGWMVYQRQHKTASKQVATPQTPGATTKPVAKTNALITALPLDLSQIESISAFRSCSGHDYSGLNADNQPETMRSMKHYITPLNSLVGSVNAIKVYAPFDGQVMAINPEQTPVGQQIWLTPANGPVWIFVFFHITPVVVKDQSFKAGDLIGYANLSRTTVRVFDIALNRFVDGNGTPMTREQMKQMGASYNQASPPAPGSASSGSRPSSGSGGMPQSMTQQRDSIFNNMNSDVLAKFAGKGITPANIVETKAQRDASPCANSGEQLAGTATDNVTLKQ